MGILIGRDRAGEIQFRMCEPGYDPIDPPPDRIIFDGRFAASRIIADPLLSLPARTLGTAGTATFDYPDLGFVPACKFFIFRPAGGDAYYNSNQPMGTVNNLSDPNRSFFTESVFISGALGTPKVERGGEALVTSSRVTIRNWLVGAGYVAKVFLFVT